MLLATISFLLNKHVQNVDYVMIDGIKYTDALSIETAVNNSLANVKIETQDIFSSLDVLDLDSLK